MANFSTLKAAINAVIKTNGQKEITGEVLNQVLNAMVTSLGANYQFAGVATPSTNPGTPDQNVFYMATEAGTYTNFNATVLPAGISILLWNGSWSHETFFEVDSVPTSGSDNLISSGAVFEKMKLDGGAYDVSAHNSGATFASLSALLSSENLNTLIPVDVRHGGMNIKFVQSSDNKYMQFRLMKDSWSTTVTDWQGVDDEPTLGSGNLVKSGGVFAAISPLNREVFGDYSLDMNWTPGYISTSGVINNSSVSVFSQPFLLKAGDTISVGTRNSNIAIICSSNAESLSVGDSVNVIQTTSFTDQFEAYSYTATADIKIVVCVLRAEYTLSLYNNNNIKEILANADNEIGMLKTEVDGTISKNIIWSNGYINTTGNIMSSSLSLFSQPILLNAGEKVVVGTQNTNICVIGFTSAESLSVGDSISVIKTIPSSATGFVTNEYTATENIKIVLCVLASNYSLDFYDTDNLDFRVKKIEEHYPFVENGVDDLALTDNNKNILVWFKKGHIKTKNFDSSELTMKNQENTDIQICDENENVVLKLKNGQISTKQFNGKEVADITAQVHKYISAEQYNQIPIEKCEYDKMCHLPDGTVYKGKVEKTYEQFNYITRIALFGDLHIGYGYSFKNVPKSGYNGYGWKNWEDYIELSLKRASNKVPDFGIALGDQLSSIDEYIYSRGGVGIVERSDWYNRIRQFNYPLFNVFGNHDNAIPDFIHKGVIEIKNIRIIVFHMDIISTLPLSTYNISDMDFAWLENAVKDSHDKGFITILASHYPIIAVASEGVIPEEVMGTLLVNNHGQDLIDLCKTYNVRLHIHGHVHPTGLPYRLMTDNGVPFDMTEVEIGLGARAYVLLEIRGDGFHFTEYPLTRGTGTVEEDGVIFNTYEILDDNSGRTLFVPFYNQASGTIRSEAWTPYPPGTE